MHDSFVVLIADDEPVSRAIAKRYLTQSEYTVLVASNGREALDLYTQHHPSIVITDWRMPDMNGIELCKAIRAESRDLYTYIIMLTGQIEKEHIVTGLEAGADESCLKPDGIPARMLRCSLDKAQEKTR